MDDPSKFLFGPSTVLVVGSSVAESVAAAIDGHDFPAPVTSGEVRRAEGVDLEASITADRVADAAAARERLAADETVGCVVVTEGAAPVDCVAAITGDHPDLPVVAYPTDGDELLASATTRAGAFAYLPGELTDRDPGRSGDDAAGHGALVETVEDALFEHDRRYRAATERDMFDALLQEVETSIYVKDDRARHLKLSDVSGAPGPQQAVGKTDWEVYSWDETSKAEALADDRQVIEEGESIRNREEVHGPPDSRRWLRTTKLPWTDCDRTRGLVGLTLDVSEEREEIRDLRAQNRRLDDFASFVSHDLRNPLHVAMSFLELSRERDVDRLDRVADALDRMESLIEDLSRLASSDGLTPAPLGGVDLPSLLHVVWEGVRTDTARLDVALPGGTVVYTNRLQLKPLFENLFKNALDHAGEDVTVRVGPLADGFYVADDGPGIPEDERENVFEEGYTTDSQGTGTGLAIVSEIAGAHGWDLHVTESESGGARFEFCNVARVTDPPATVETGTTHALSAGTDVGDVLNPGSSEPLADSVTCADDASDGRGSDGWRVRAAGYNILEDTNEFHFRWAQVDGPVRIEARLDAFDGPADASKAGVMVRDRLDEDARFGYVGRRADGRTELLWRSDLGDPTRSQHLESGDRAFERVALERVGDTVTAFVSADGEEWTAVDQRTVALDDPVHVGLVACSLNIGTYCEAEFRDVRVASLEPDESR